MTLEGPGPRAEKPSGPASAPPIRPAGRVRAPEAAAVFLTVLWLALAAGFFLFLWDDAGSGAALLTLGLATALPVAVIWIAATSMRTIDALRAESGHLRATVEQMRHAYLTSIQTTQRPPLATPTPAPEPAGPPATFVSRRDPAAAPAPTAAAEDEPTLALGGETATDPVSAAVLIRAMDFPDNPKDREGIAALRAALADRNLAKLIRAAQDVLTLLSQDGIFMDDLTPDRAHPDLWRRFAGGERGRTIAALGGIRDRSSLTLSAERMRQDTIFRDAAHHFLRQFDRSFQSFEKTATDADIAAFTESRTARAFMLLGRVSGTFD